MAFTKRTIKDRVIQYSKRYQLVEVSPGIFDLVPVTGTITEAGTPINKDLLQRYEDGLDAALEKTGDGKEVTVTFTEATTEADIATGENLSAMFGKILKKFKNIINGTTAVGKANILATARTINGVLFNGSANITITDSTKAPNSHASSATTYGAGTPTLHGHVKTINALTQASHVDGTALSAYQGKVLNDKISPNYVYSSATISGTNTNFIAIPAKDKTQIFVAFSGWRTGDINFMYYGGRVIGGSNAGTVNFILTSTAQNFYSFTMGDWSMVFNIRIVSGVIYIGYVTNPGSTQTLTIMSV